MVFPDFANTELHPSSKHQLRKQHKKPLTQSYFFFQKTFILILALRCGNEIARLQHGDRRILLTLGPIMAGVGVGKHGISRQLTKIGYS